MTYHVKHAIQALFNVLHDTIIIILIMVLVLNALKTIFISKLGITDLIVITAEVVYVHTETNDLNVLINNTSILKHDNVSLNVILVLK